MKQYLQYLCCSRNAPATGTNASHRQREAFRELFCELLLLVALASDRGGCFGHVPVGSQGGTEMRQVDGHRHEVLCVCPVYSGPSLHLSLGMYRTCRISRGCTGARLNTGPFLYALMPHLPFPPGGFFSLRKTGNQQVASCVVLLFLSVRLSVCVYLTQHMC